MIRNCDTCKYRKYKDEMYPCNNCVVWDGKTLFYTLWRDGEPLTPPETCEWTYQSYDVYYDTQCGNIFQFTVGELSDAEDFKFCPFCGREIKEVKEKE